MTTQPGKKILIISYYWPPSGGSGVQRWLKFVKYLPEEGWKPYVFTPENPAFAVRDESLLKDVPMEAEVIRFPIWEPYEAFFKLSKITGSKKTAKPTDLVSAKQESLFHKISTWIRGNLFIPDPRVFWVRPAASFLHDFLRENEIGTIITTGPPHSMHLIGLRLKKKNPSLQWIVDLRDPWSQWGFLDSLKAGTFARNMHKRLEAKVLRNADKVITVTPFYVRQFEKLGGRKVQLLTNGYDESDFKDLTIQKTDKFVIRHVGIVNEKCDPRPFMLSVKKLLSTHEVFRSSVHIDFTGEVHPQFQAFVRESPELSAITSFTPPVPHKQLIPMYGQSSLLLFVIHGYKNAEGYLPGKLFEYLATGLPILGVGPEDGDAAVVLQKSEAGLMIDAHNHQGLTDFLLTKFAAWQNASGSGITASSAYKSYSRKELTKDLTEIL